MRREGPRTLSLDRPVQRERVAGRSVKELEEDGGRVNGGGWGGMEGLCSSFGAEGSGIFEKTGYGGQEARARRRVPRVGQLRPSEWDVLRVRACAIHGFLPRHMRGRTDRCGFGHRIAPRDYENVQRPSFCLHPYILAPLDVPWCGLQTRRNKVRGRRDAIPYFRAYSNNRAGVW